MQLSTVVVLALILCVSLVASQDTTTEDWTTAAHHAGTTNVHADHTGTTVSTTPAPSGSAMNVAGVSSLLLVAGSLLLNLFRH